MPTAVEEDDTDGAAAGTEWLLFMTLPLAWSTAWACGSLASAARLVTELLGAMTAVLEPVGPAKPGLGATKPEAVVEMLPRALLSVEALRLTRTRPLGSLLSTKVPSEGSENCRARIMGEWASSSISCSVGRGKRGERREG